MHFCDPQNTGKKGVTLKLPVSTMKNIEPPLEGPFGGALKKVYVAVTSGHISHGCLAGAQWTALGGVGRCAARVRHA